MDDSNDPAANGRHDGGAGLPASRLGNDDLYDALAHQRRRYLLYTLLEDTAWSLRELARKVASWENSTPEGDVDEDEIERVYASLYHAHVPKLTDLGIVEFDRQTETIAKGPNAESILTALEHTGASVAEELEAHARKGDNDG